MSLQHRKRGHASSSQPADKHSAEKLFSWRAKRSVFTQREVMKRHYARPYRAFWLFGPQQAATGRLRELHGAAAACLSAFFPGSGSFLRVWRRLQGPPMETLRFLLVDDLLHRIGLMQSKSVTAACAPNNQRARPRRADARLFSFSQSKREIIYSTS